MLSRIKTTIAEHGLLRPGERVLVAVSGGPDSMALLHALWELAPAHGYRLVVASVDHGLRGEAKREVAAVGKHARALGLAFVALRANVARAARHAHGSSQEAARLARLGALERAAKRHGCPRIALGHTADDQAETVLFRIIRGTGVRGLTGIPYERAPFVRPLLDVRRDEVVAYLAKRRVAAFDDPSNRDPRFSRSRIRHEVLPALRRENPRVTEALLGLAADAADVLRGGPDEHAPSLSRGAAAVLRRLKHRGQGTRTVDVRGGSLEVRYGRIAFLPREASPPVSPPPEPVVIAAPGAYRLGAFTVRITVPRTARPDGARALFERAALAWPLVLRPPRPGDRMRPRDGRGSRKLSDLLIDAKVPRPERAGWPVLAAADGTILWVRGLRPSEVGKPKGDGRALIEVKA